MSKLSANNISKSYKNKAIIKDVTLELYEGEIVCLLGVSGVGKTTLFNILSGVLSPDAGKVFLDNRDITGEAGYISYMLQKDLLLPYKTVLDNACLPLIIKKENKQVARRRAEAYFEMFGIDGTQNKYLHQLSGGMRQRAALLRTYLFSQEVALLDEPFSALDTITKSKMHDWYLKVMEKIKLSTLFITHDIDEAIILSDRIYVMTGIPGRITSEIEIHHAKPREEAFILSEDFIDYKRKIIKILENDGEIKY